MSNVEFVQVEVEPGEAAPEGVSLRFKAAQAGAARAAVRRIRYEAEDGTAGFWRIAALDAAGAPSGPARAVRVEDSSEGTTCLVVGGPQGLLLEHETSDARERVPYLVLAVDTPME